MYEGRGELRYGVQQGVFGLDGDPVRLSHTRLAVHHDRHLGAQPVPDPAQPQLTHPAHTGDLPQGPFGRVDQLRVHGVHHTPEHLAGGVAQHQQDRGRDRQAHQRVGELPPQCRAARPHQDRQ